MQRIGKLVFEYIEKNKSKLWFHIGFWVIVFLVNMGPEWQQYSSTFELFEVTILKTLMQGLVAYITFKYLTPYFLNQEKFLHFGLSLLLILFLVAQFFVAISYLYLEPKYPDTYGYLYISRFGDYNLLERIGFSEMIKYLVFLKVPKLLFPTAVLIAFDFHEKQKLLLELREQKNAAELNALKNQLNPHFIFNTLNNIYSLAIKRSELTAEAVAKLSGILDYVLYRCNENHVALVDEIEMIENYLALEKIRFGERVQVTLVNNVKEHIEVAPLLYLTLVENAFKHGVSQELKQANIRMMFSKSSEGVIFDIVNSKPQEYASNESNQSIGLKNLKRQLELLYPYRHILKIAETQTEFTAQLVLRDEG